MVHFVDRKSAEGFSRLRPWDLYFCMDHCTLKLLELDCVFRYLLMWVRALEELIDIKDYMHGSMTVGVYNLWNKDLRRIADTFEKALESETMAPEELNHEEEERMKQQPLLVFESLFVKVHKVLNKKNKPVMYKLLLGDIFDRLLMLKPFMEEKAKAFDGQDEELRIFKAKMVKGVEIVRKSSEFSLWGGYSKRKYKCINNLLGLNQSLGRLLCIMGWVEARKARNELHFRKHLSKAFNEFKHSYLVQNQTESADHDDGLEQDDGVIESHVRMEDQAKTKALAFRRMVETARDEFKRINYWCRADSNSVC